MQSLVSALVEAERSNVRELRVMDIEEGDLRFQWDPEDEQQVELAREQFNAAKKKKMVAYRVKKDGTRGELIREFDPQAESIIMAPPLVGG